VYAITCADVTCDQARNYPQMDRDKDGYYCEAQCGSYTPSKKTETKTTPDPKKSEETKAKANTETKKTTSPKTTVQKQPENKTTQTKVTPKNSKYIN